MTLLLELATQASLQPRQRAGSPFTSFWMGGFEGADHCNAQGGALDMAQAHGHLAHLDEDYAAAAGLGLTSVRESVGWRLCESAPGVFDFSRPLRMARCARRHGLQIQWTLMHYGTPPGISLHSDALIDRFAAFARAAAQVLGEASDAVPVYTPINEINFLAWAASHSRILGAPEVEVADESTLASGYGIKRRLVRATLAATEAIRNLDRRARFMQVEPLVHVVAPLDKPYLAPLAAEVAAYQWQTWDLLSGRLEPALGGHAGMLDLLGVNHYHNGQWEVETEERLHWHAREPRRRPFDGLLQDAWDRYGRPIVVSETSHVGAGRALWLSDMAAAVERASKRGVDVLGLCLYPLVDRPDWNDPDQWHHSGLWDVAWTGIARERQQRVLHKGYAAMLRQWRLRLPLRPAPKAPPPRLPGIPEGQAVVVFSRSRWDLALGRTQHLLMLLAHHVRVVFVEEPVYTPGDACLVRVCPAPGIDVLCPHTPLAACGFDGPQLPVLRRLLQRYLQDEPMRGQPIAWLDTPMALPLAVTVQPRALVYDRACGDWSTGASSNGTWMRRERVLLECAAVVLTRGPAQWHDTLVLAPGAVLVPNGVDTAHFEPHGLPANGSEAHEAERLLAGIGLPRLCFIGTSDARVDLSLLAQVAQARPQWQIVMIGPVRQTEVPEALPQSNVHWLGAQPYALLPFLLARCAIGILPFRCEPRTEHLNPAQLLECLAAARPVVSTPLADVLAMRHGGAVRVGVDADEFMTACECALREPMDAAAQMLPSWEQGAEQIVTLLASLKLPDGG